MSAALRRPSLNFASKAAVECNPDVLNGLLSPFQVEKLTFFFTEFFDNDKNGIINAKDFSGLNERLRLIAGWGTDSPEYLSMVDNNRVFLECLLDQVEAEKDTDGLENRTWEEAKAPSKIAVDSVSLSNWIHLWAKLCQGSAGIDDFPIWVQLIPKTIFNIICNKNGESAISKESLRTFYRDFTGLKGETLAKVSDEGFRAMSANGDYELDYQNYKLLFSNFLLGRTIYGPGKYVFGCFDNRDMTEPYKIVYE